MVKGFQMKYVGERKHQHLDMIPLDFDNVNKFVSIFNACYNKSSIQVDDVLCNIKKMQGYIIYDSVAVGIIWLEGNKIKNISVLPEHKKGYLQKALLKSIELIGDNILTVVDVQEQDLFLNNGFIIEKEL